MVGRKRASSTKAVSNSQNDVVSEHPIVLLPVHRRMNAISSLNRVQFPQHRYWLRSMARLPQQRCFVEFKHNVKQLRIAFLREHFEALEADQLTPATTELSTRCDTFTGEGFSQHQNLNYALGFMRNGKLFLLPVEQQYEMHYANVPAMTDEPTVAVLPANGTVDANHVGHPPVAVPFAMAPVRIRFARVETDAQKRRREQSALFKQRLIDKEPWVPLKLQKKDVTELYEKDIAKYEKSKEQRPVSTYGGTLRLRTGADRSTQPG